MITVNFSKGMAAMRTENDGKLKMQTEERKTTFVPNLTKFSRHNYTKITHKAGLT